MKTLTTALKNHMAEGCTTLTVCILLKLVYKNIEITGITQANPAVVTTRYGHGLTTGDQLSIEEVAGMVEVNDDLHGGTDPGQNWLFHTVTVISPTTFSLDGVDSTGYTAYTDGGVASQVMGFTIHDVDIPMHGIRYKSDAGVTDSAIKQGQDLSVDNLEVSGIMAFVNLQNRISAFDIAGGRLDFSELRIFIVNYEDLSQEFMWVKRGFLGEIERTSGGIFQAKFRGLSEMAQQLMLNVTTPSCRYDLGDVRCTVDLTTHTVTGTVTGVTDRATFSDSSRTEADDYFNYGKLTWTVGDNAGLQQEVKDWTLIGTEAELFERMPEDIQIGDQYSLSRGCRKDVPDCRDIYDNILNFGGEPYLPGEDFLIQFVIPNPPDVVTN